MKAFHHVARYSTLCNTDQVAPRCPAILSIRLPDHLRSVLPSAITVAARSAAVCDRNRPALVILAESAVDAISARTLRIEQTREHGAVVASTAGVANSVPPWIEDWEPKRILCAYDADRAGDAAAHRLAVNDPRLLRLRPHGAKDWNEILQQRQ